MNTRNKRIDIIKGIGILLIVLGHTQMPLTHFVNLFHVGLFFIASGFCFKERYSDSLDGVKSFFLKRLRQLYAPFVLWNLGYLCLHNLFCKMNLYSSNAALSSSYPLISRYYKEDMIRHAIQIITMQGGEQLAGASWFLRALFVMEILFILLDYLAKFFAKSKFYIIRIGTAILFLLTGAIFNARNIILPYNFATVCSCWLLFVLGIWLHSSAENSPAMFEKNGLSALSGLIILILLSRFGAISYDSNVYPNILFFLIAAVSGWFMCWGFAGLLEKKLPCLGILFTYIGRHTLEILFLHLLSFKVISFVFVVTHGMELYYIAAFPVLTCNLWFLYFLAGITLPLLMEFIYRKIKEKFMLRRHGKLIFCGVILIILLSISVIGLRSPQKASSAAPIHLTNLEKEEENFTLVYNKEYYLEHNPDVQDIIGEDPKKVFDHFYEYGMTEGRVASSNFDVHYYRAENEDLAEQFGNTMKDYYLHYIEYGYSEGRKGSPTALTASSVVLTCKYAENQNLLLELLNIQSDFLGKTGFLFELPAYGRELSEDLTPIWASAIKEGEKISVPFHSLTNKFILAVMQDGTYVPVSNIAYLSNPEALAEYAVPLPTPRSKKGLQVLDSMEDDIDSLNVSYPFRNLIIQHIMSPDGSGDVQPYSYGGKTYYFKNDVLAELDRHISKQTKNNSIVSAGIINISADGFDELYYPGIDMNTGAAFYAANTADKAGLQFFEAFISFMAKRYNGTDPNHGMIGCWMVGNEVNESGTYNYMGEKNITEYMEEYTRTFRIVYNLVKSENPNARIYVPMEPWWGIDSNNLTYGGKEFLDTFNQKIIQEGNIDWGLAYHAYSYPLSDPKVLNDGYRTVDTNGELTLDGYVTSRSIRSVTISMENIEVLTEYLHDPSFQNPDGEIRSIILSEQGYTSNSNVYGRCEAQQTASMLYAYYKTESIADIDAFIYFVQCDSPEASLRNDYYQFGLSGVDSNGTIYQKLSHDVYQIMDTKDSLDFLDTFKTVLGIQSWTDVIPTFDKSVFDTFPSLSNEALHALKVRRSLENAVIVGIEDQKYTGQECLPNILVMYDNQPLINDIDYDVVYLNNVHPGTATAVIVGLNNYRGVITTTFKIQ